MTPDPSDAPRKLSATGELARRILTAAIALPLLAAAIFLGPSWLVPTIALGAALLGYREILSLAAPSGASRLWPGGFTLLVAAFASVLHPHPPLWPLALVVLLSMSLGLSSDMQTTIPSAAVASLGAFYLGGLCGTIAALRVMGDPSEGPWRVTLLLVTVMTADTFAYFGGRAFGRHRLAPRVSPGKTVEGGAFSLVGGALGALIVRSLGLPAIPVSQALGLGAAVAVAATLGDLVESMLKRWAGVKDSGALFPGHGGMLDRLDSLLFGSAVLYYYFSVLKP